jgi:hypothetical protein
MKASIAAMPAAFSRAQDGLDYSQIANPPAAAMQTGEMLSLYDAPGAG